MMCRRELERLKDKEGKVPHTVKSKNEFQGPSSNKTRVRTFRVNPKAIKHALRMKMLKTFICPPLVIPYEGELFSVRSLLDVAAKDKFTLELTEMGEVRIYPSDSFAYFDIANMLLENNLPLRGLKQGGRNGFKVICVGLHRQEDMTAIQEALGALGHDVLQISRPLEIVEFPPVLPIYTITLERAENNWEIFNVTKLLGMKVTIRPLPKVVPLPTCSNCLQVGHLEYECGRRLCDSCDCSFIKGRNVIPKLAYEWPLPVKVRLKGPEKAKKQLRKGIRRSSDTNTGQQHESRETANGHQDASNELQDATGEPQETVNRSQVEDSESEEEDNEKVENICRIDGITELEWQQELARANERRFTVKASKKLENHSFTPLVGNTERRSFVNKDDDGTDEEELSCSMGHTSSDSSLISTYLTTRTYTSTTCDSPVFDDSSIPSDREPNTKDPNCWKKMLKEWLIDVTTAEELEESSSLSSLDSTNLLKISRKKIKDPNEGRSKKVSIHNQEMLTCNFTHTRHSKSHEKANESSNPLGRRPIIKRKKAHPYTTTIGCGTNNRVNIIKERTQGENSEPVDLRQNEEEEVYEENEVHTLIMSAEYSRDDEAGHSRQESPVRDEEADDETDDEMENEIIYEIDDEMDDDRNGGRRFFEENERYLYEEPEIQAENDLQREFERQNDRGLQREPERQVDNVLQREPESLFQRELEMALGSNSDRSFVPLRNRDQIRRPLSDPRTMAERFAAVAPASFPSSHKFCPTLYNRRYPYRYEEFVKTYMGINNTEEIPEETATAWLDMIYHEIESLLNYVDRIGRAESYSVLLEKVEDRFHQKFGHTL